jgi:hypothetical protein
MKQPGLNKYLEMCIKTSTYYNEGYKDLDGILPSKLFSTILLASF